MKSTGGTTMNNQVGRTVIIGALLGLVVGGVGGWFVGSQRTTAATGRTSKAPIEKTPMASAGAPAAAPVAAKYGFEADSAIGWSCGDYERALACKGVGHSNELHREGLSSLKFDVDLSGTSERRSSGEIWVDVSNIKPAAGAGPVSLAGRTLTAWVYATPGSLGDKDRPNGFQLFVKDKAWKAKYGPWHDVVEGQWTQLSFPVGAASADFDPGQVNAIGLKLAAGEGSSAKFQGAIFVDAVNW